MVSETVGKSLLAFLQHVYRHDWIPRLLFLLRLLLSLSAPDDRSFKMSSIAKKLGFGRTNTSQAGDITFEPPGSLSNSRDSIEKENGVTATQRITRGETLEGQRKLKDFEREHRWDPNIPSDTLEDLDDAIHKSTLPYESTLVRAFEENSPYPEVRAAVRNVCQKQKPFEIRISLIDSGTTRTFPPTQFKPGPLVWS